MSWRMRSLFLLLGLALGCAVSQWLQVHAAPQASPAGELSIASMD